MRHRLPANVEYADLVQAGMLGLDQALSGYSKTGGASFDTYAYRRIQGAMLDELRSGDHVSRGVRSRMRKVQMAAHQLEHDLMRAPRAHEIAERLGWPLKEVHDTMVEAGAAGQRTGDVELDEVADNEAALAVREADDSDFMRADEFADPFRSIQRREEHAAVNNAYSRLDERDRQLLDMLYKADMSQQDVADHWGVSSSRICQMHSNAVAKLKAAVNKPPLQAVVAAAIPVEQPELRADIERMRIAAFPDFVERRVATTATGGSATGDWIDQAARRHLS
jgi:RNA polymerase sigma factor for flagellar operon FliA